jgi:transcriptional regulator with XRE-family HTH domain
VASPLGGLPSTSTNDEEGESGAYARAVGARLRLARQRLRLSLQAVEALSSQEFKASVLGAYERGERAISVPRLQRLASIYKVPVDRLLPSPETDGDSPGNGRDRTMGEGDEIDIEAKLDSIGGPERELLTRLVKVIRAQRRQPASGPISIRAEDRRAIRQLVGWPEDAVSAVEGSDALERPSPTR